MRKDANNINKLTVINRELLQELIRFLEPFSEATGDLEGEDTGTICYVLPNLR